MGTCQKVTLKSGQNGRLALWDILATCYAMSLLEFGGGNRYRGCSIHFHKSRKLLDGFRSFLDMLLLIHYNNPTQTGVSFHKLFFSVFRGLGGT